MAKYDRGDYNFGGKIALFFALIFTILFFFWVSFFYGGVDLKELPQKGPNAAEAADQGQPAVAPDAAAAAAPEGAAGATAPTEPASDPAAPTADPAAEPTTQPNPDATPAPAEKADKSSAVDLKRLRWKAISEPLVRA